MNKYTDKQIEDTLKLIDSTILNCEKIPKITFKSSDKSFFCWKIVANPLTEYGA